ncbi:hypothetical protein [Sessilibacter sp. MAH4]
MNHKGAIRIILSITLLFVMKPIFAQSDSQAEPKIYVCELRDLTRRVEIEYLDPLTGLPCSVNYYKDDEAPGEKKVLWQADNSTSYCEEKANSFVEKLGTWGWSCH